MKFWTQKKIMEVEKNIQKRLDGMRGLSRIPLKIAAHRLEDDWLCIAVTPLRPGIRAYDYVETLVKVENEVKKEKKIENLVLVPAFGD